MAPMAILAQRAGKPGGVAGDATIQLEIKDQVGRTVAQSNVAVNKPIEVLYAVDGTTDTAADNTVVRQFFTRFQQTKHYYDGPDLAGTKGPEIFRNVENDILSDVAVAESKYHRDVAIDLVGYSRGAVIVATVAKDLLTTHMINGTPQVLSVHWMGLFDPVSMFVGITPRRGLSWATMVPPNVQSCGCAIKQLGVLPTQKNLKGYGEDGSVLGNYGPAGSTKKFWLNHIDLGHNGSSLLDNIRPLDWMIQQAQANKVPVK